jgi:hypothetical protein
MSDGALEGDLPFFTVLSERLLVKDITFGVDLSSGLASTLIHFPTSHPSPSAHWLRSLVKRPR